MESRAVGLESIVRFYALKIRPQAQAELAWYVPGIGELYVYDTALRLGAKLGVFPEKVYLHACTRIRVRNLGLDARSTALRMASLRRALRSLKPREVEDVLCIFKDRFG